MFKEEVVYTYEVNPYTMAILSREKNNGTFNTIILEGEKEYTAFLSPTKMVDQACKYYGASLRGRLDGTKDVINITHKAPIAIDPSLGMYFFPTASPQNKRCSWLAHSYIADISPGKLGSTTAVHFTNDKTIILDVSYGSMRNQVNRTAQFRYKMDGRMND